MPAQTRAVEALLDKGGVFDVADAALIETVFVLEKIYKMDRALVRENIFAVTRNKQFMCNKKLFEDCMPLYVSRPTLSIMDCALVVYARLSAARPLHTFDKDLAKHVPEDTKHIS